MSQLTFNTSVPKLSNERLRGIIAAVTRYLVAGAVIAAVVAGMIVLRVAAAAIANGEVMKGLREALLRIAEAMGMPL